MIEADEHSLYFDVRDRSTRYAIRFDRDRQRWTLEGFDDSGILMPRDCRDGATSLCRNKGEDPGVPGPRGWVAFGCQFVGTQNIPFLIEGVVCQV